MVGSMCQEINKTYKKKISQFSLNNSPFKFFVLAFRRRRSRRRQVFVSCLPLFLRNRIVRFMSSTRNNGIFLFFLHPSLNVFFLVHPPPPPLPPPLPPPPDSSQFKWPIICQKHLVSPNLVELPPRTGSVFFCPPPSTCYISISSPFFFFFPFPFRKPQFQSTSY